VLIDPTDAVAEVLNKPFAALSMEMIYRGLYHFTVAHHRGKAHNLIPYLAADAQGLGILKRERKNRTAITDLLSLTTPPPPYRRHSAIKRWGAVGRVCRVAHAPGEPQSGQTTVPSDPQALIGVY